MIRIKKHSHLVELLDHANKSNTPIAVGGKTLLVIDSNGTHKSSQGQPLIDLVDKKSNKASPLNFHRRPQ